MPPGVVTATSGRLSRSKSPTKTLRPNRKSRVVGVMTSFRSKGGMACAGAALRTSSPNATAMTRLLVVMGCFALCAGVPNRARENACLIAVLTISPKSYGRTAPRTWQ